jgi:Ca2+-binding EF-hand superfamily protein
MKTKLLFLTAATALSCGALSLIAQDPPPPPAGSEGKPPGEGRPPGPPPGSNDRLAEFIKRSDTDGDGKISKEEFVNTTKKESEDRFSKIDANSDGFADKPEIEEAGRRMREAQGRRPEDGGPNMRRPEGPDGGFRRPEGGGDGVRPRPGQEGEAGKNPPPGGEGFRRPEGGDGGFRRPEGSDGGRREGGRSGGLGMMGDMLQRMDKDGDGVLTKEEYLNSSEERFAQMDENKDGKVTKEEIEAMGRKMREMMGGGRPGGDGGFRRPEGGDGNRPRPEGDRPKRPEAEAPAPKA